MPTPTQSHLVRVARLIKQRLQGHAFLTMPRVEITGMVREVSGENATRLKTSMADQLERALLEQGVRVYPSLLLTTTGDTVRVFQPGTVVASLVDILANPDEDTDKELAAVTTKVKGLWNWND